jgi:hypothetical protein
MTLHMFSIRVAVALHGGPCLLATKREGLYIILIIVLNLVRNSSEHRSLYALEKAPVIFCKLVRGTDRRRDDDWKGVLHNVVPKIASGI